MRIVRIVVTLLLTAAFLVLPRPAQACACGAVVSSSGAAISGESALVVWDGTRETITMAMLLQGTAKDAGWIMPVPAGTDVSLGDKAVFPRLVDATKPVERTLYDWSPLTILRGAGSAAGAGAGAPVQVEKVAAIGPFQVTWLTGTDAAAVNRWLTEQGYPTRPQVVPTFQSYLDKDWRILAVKLLPAAGELSGTLDPLTMTFPTTEPVYPILLSKHAASRQGINLYVAAAHRMAITDQAAPTMPLSVRFAGRVPADVAGLSRGLGDQSGAAPTVYLTAYSGYLLPNEITKDFRFGVAANDDPYVTYLDRTVWMGWVFWLAIPVVLVAVVVAIVVGAVRARRPS